MSRFPFISRISHISRIAGRRAAFFLSVLLLGFGSSVMLSAQSGSPPKVVVSGSDLEVSPPKLVRWVTADLSHEGRIAHYRGVCVVSLVVDTEGRPQNVHVIRPIGMDLEANAIQAAKHFRFIPAMGKGKPVPVKVTVEVPFKIEPSRHV